MAQSGLERYVDAEREAILARCTACGECVAACPTLPFLEVREVPAASIARGLLSVLRRQPDRAAAIFAEACSGSAQCRDVCPEQLDPYTFMRLAKLDLQLARPSREPAPRTNLFRMIELSRGLQMPRQDVRWFTGRPAPGVSAEVVFYLGCNVLRTPHIVLNMIDVLDHLGVSFHTVGGGGNCCGIIQFREGDLAAAEAVSCHTLANFAAFRPSQVVTWCPTCDLHLNDFGAAHLERPFRVVHVTRFLAEHLDWLSGRPLNPIRARVALDEHAPLNADDSVVEDTRAILGCIPGLEIVDVPQHALGYQCSAVRDRAVSVAATRALCEAAAAAGVDYLVTIYHSCHRQLVGAEQRYPFKVENFSSLLARALGVEHEDRYKRYKLMGDADQILQHVLATVGENGRTIEELRRAIEWEFLKR